MSKIDYQNLLDNALKSVVKDALIHAQFNGLGDGTHFFITFKTRAPGVVLPDFLRIRYPDIMTIVLQYSYNNLHVSDKEFGVLCYHFIQKALPLQIMIWNYHWMKSQTLFLIQVGLSHWMNLEKIGINKKTGICRSFYKAVLNDNFTLLSV